MKGKKVLLLVESQKDAMDRAVSLLKKPTKRFAGMMIISFPDFETLGKVITGSRLELLKAIRIHKPKSIQELSRVLKRDFKNVYQDVRILADVGLIDLKESGPRKASKPESKYSEIVLAA